MEGKNPFCSQINCPRQSSCDAKRNNGVAKEACAEIIKSLINAKSISRPYADTDALLSIMNECIQQGAENQSVGHYCIDSEEMIRTISGDEIHILTNEMLNYDYLPIASLMIALNTMRGVHYYYYATEDQKEMFSLFKERIKGYYRGTTRARRDVVSWIRKEKAKVYNYNEFLITLNGVKLSNLIEILINNSSVLDKNDIKSKILKDMRERNERAVDTPVLQLNLYSRVLEWLEGTSKMDATATYNFISKLALVIDSIKQFDELYNDKYIKSYCDKLQLLVDMRDFTIWQTGDYRGDLVSSRSNNELIEVFQTRNPASSDKNGNMLISEPMKRWLLSAPNAVMPGELLLTDEELEKYLQCIHFCELQDNSPYKLCYNFALFVCDKGPAGAWYTTYANKFKRDMGKLDNWLFMVDFPQYDTILLGRLKNVYKKLIESNSDVKQLLQANSSKILNNLSI